MRLVEPMICTVDIMNVNLAKFSSTKHSCYTVYEIQLFSIGPREMNDK